MAPHVLRWLVVALAFLIGIATGLLLLRSAAGSGKSHRRPMEVPEIWPFDPRRVTSSVERKAWAWLRETFPEQQVLLKLPVTRFVIPQNPERAREWYQLLANVYCTFTICTNDGRVLGCLDVMTTSDGLPRMNRQIKETLLEQCGINYWAVPHDRLPDSSTLRAEFLGDENRREVAAEPPVSQFQALENVRTRLHETLDRRRSTTQRSDAPSQFTGSDLLPIPSVLQNSGAQNSDPQPNLGFAETVPYDLNSSGLPSGLYQLNSFLTPEQSRRAGLDR